MKSTTTITMWHCDEPGCVTEAQAFSPVFPPHGWASVSWDEWRPRVAASLPPPFDMTVFQRSAVYCERHANNRLASLRTLPVSPTA